MTVENLGVKLYQGLKQDRVSDSLGSSGDGVNTNVTIPLTWTNLTSNTSIANSKLNYTETASTYIRASRDLDGVITLADDFVIRFELNKTNNPTNESNGTQPLISISSSLTDAWFNAQDVIGMYLTQNSSGQTNGYFAVACDNQVTYNGDSSVNSYTWTTGTLYFEVIKNSTADTVTVTAYTNSDYSTGGQGTASISTSGKTISGLRYLSMRNFADSQRPSVVFELDNLKIYNNKTSATGTPDVSDDFATNSGSGQKLGTGCYDYAGGDASSPRVELGDDLADWTFLTDGSDWTWVGWWNPDSLTVTGSVYGSSLLYTMAGGSTANTGMNIYVDGEGDLWGLMLRSVGSSYVFTNTDSGANIVAGEWQHLAVVHDGTSSTKTMKFYVNGALGGTITGTGNAYSSAENPRQPMIGGVGSGTLGWSSGYDGKSDDMAFYKRKLSVTEIQALVNNVDKSTSFVSDFSNSSAWTQVGTQITVSSDRVNFSSALCGTDRRVYKALGFTLDDTFVAEWEFSLTDVGSSQAQPFALTAGTAQLDNSTTNQDSIYFKSSSAGYQLACKDGTTNSQSSANSYTNGTTLYARLIRDGTSGTLSIYSDSGRFTLVSSATHTIPATVTGLNTVQCAVDAVQGDTRTISGTLSNVKIWNGTTVPYDTNGALVSSLSNKSELKAYYSFDSLDLDVAKTFEDDFSTYANQTTANTAWVPQDDTAGKRVNISTDKYDFDVKRNDTNDACIHDLGSALSDTKFVLRYKIDFTTVTSTSSSEIYASWGLHDGDGTVVESTAQDFMVLNFRVTSSSKDLALRSGNNQAMNGNQTDATFSHALAVETLYVEMIRTSATSYTIELFSDSTYTTSIEKKTGACESGTSGLRYLGYKNEQGSHAEGAIIGTIDDVEVWNGINTLVGCQNNYSSTSPLEALDGVRDNSIFEQTDSTPSYWWYNGTSWVLDASTAPTETIIDWTGLSTGTDEGDGIYKTTSDNSWSNVGRSTKIYKIAGNTKVSLRTTSDHLEFGLLKTSTSNVTCFECNSNAYATDNMIIAPQSDGNVKIGDGAAPSGSAVATSWDSSSYTTGTNFTMEIKSNGNVEFAMDGVVKHTFTGNASGNEFYFYVGNYGSGESRGLTLGELT